MKNLRKIQVVAVFLLVCEIQGFGFEDMSKMKYKCYEDYCDWKTYCDHEIKRCKDCESRFQDCFRLDQEPICPVFCIKFQRCPPLKQLEHGHYTRSDEQKIIIGLKFLCDEGYHNTGVNETVCKSGRWSHLEPNVSQPFCKKITCIIPHPPAHCRVEFPRNVTELGVGSKIYYICENGYVLRGKDSYSTCLTNGINGIWNGTSPECVENFCKSPPIPKNGGIIIPPGLEHFVNGTWITVTCNDGFSLEGDAERQCLPNGSWSFNSATCVAKEPSIHNWIKADTIMSTASLLWMILYTLVNIWPNFRTFCKKCLKITEKNPSEKPKTDEEIHEMPRYSIPMLPADDTQNLHPLEDRRKATQPTHEPSQVVTKKCQDDIVSLMNNPRRTRANLSSKNSVTTTAVEETNQGLGTA